MANIDNPENSMKNNIVDKKVSWRDIGKHVFQPFTNHDESASQDFYLDMYRFLSGDFGQGRKKVYEKRVKQKIIKKYGRAPKNRHEIHREMKKDTFLRFWGHLRTHCNQEMFYKNSINVDNQLEELMKKSKSSICNKSLTLNNKLKIPKYQKSYDIHWMPGSFYTEITPNDISAGALYDSGGIYVMTSGKLGPYNDGAAYSLINYINNSYPDFNPKSILDIGCTVGHNTLPFKDNWKKTKVTGIDLGAPVLRYASARSKAMGYSINYSQQNAEKTNFKNASFDLIVSTMFLHETSSKAIENIFKESFRLLKPGGLMVHVEQPPFRFSKDPFEQYLGDWDTHNNNEPFWGPMHDMNLTDIAIKYKFKQKYISEKMIDLVQPTEKNKFNLGKGSWYIIEAWK